MNFLIMGESFFFIMGELLMDSPPIPQGLGGRPTKKLAEGPKNWPRTKKTVAKDQSTRSDFFCHKRLGDFFCPERLGDFFLSREVG